MLSINPAIPEIAAIIIKDKNRLPVKFCKEDASLIYLPLNPFAILKYPPWAKCLTHTISIIIEEMYPRIIVIIDPSR